jgi:hypothetical protein
LNGHYNTQSGCNKLPSVIYQIGFRKSAGNRKGEGQIVSVSINQVDMDIDTSCGKYLTSIVEGRRTGSIWFLRKDKVMAGDVIRMVVKTSVARVGVDEKRTFEAMFYVDEDAPVREVFYPGVGHSGYPILKGRVTELTFHSEDDKRKQDIDLFLDEEDF